jgi:predicted RNase H-like HicB family nuclease
MEAPVFTNYVRAALRHARYEILPSDGTFYGEIPGFNGVYAEADTLEECREELEEVLEEWILLRVSKYLPFPAQEGL